MYQLTANIVTQILREVLFLKVVMNHYSLLYREWPIVMREIDRGLGNTGQEHL